MTTSTFTYLVTGASGVIGPRLIERLIGQGHRVRALVHRTPTTLPDGVEICRGDMEDVETLRAAVESVHTVFHLAAKLHINDPSPDLRAAYDRVNKQGTRHLAEAAQAAGVQRFVFFSTVKVYGHSQPDQILDENSLLNPDSWYAETKAQAEQIVLSTLPGVVLRLAAVYGPRMKGNYLRLVHGLQHGRFIPVGQGLNRRTLVYQDDIVSAALLVADRPAASGQIYNVTDGAIHTLHDVITVICQELHRPVPRFHVPVLPVRVGVGVVEDLSHLLGRNAPIGRSLVDKLVEDIAVHGNRLVNDLGFCPQYDLKRGWEQTIQVLLQNDHPY